MSVIKTIEYIVHPLYLLGENEMGSIRLVYSLNELAKAEGKDPSKLFMLSPGNFNHFYMNPRAFQLASQWHSEMFNLIRGLSVSCLNFFVVDGYTGCGQALDTYLERHQLVLDLDHLALRGHGASRKSCVRDELEYFAKQIRKRHGKTVLYMIAQDTSI